jgi:hypothetical protein
MSVRRLRLLFYGLTVPATFVAVSLLAACGGSDTPSASTSPTPPPVAVPTPTPIPTPNLPGQANCSKLPMGTEVGVRCDMSGATLQAELDQAVAEVRRDQPGIFEETSGGTLILSPGRFFVGVIDNLDKKGLCAGFDSEEIQIKNSNAFNDQYHLRTSRGYLRTGPSVYRATCFPAAFPLPPPPFQPNNGCKLASSREVTCSREADYFYLADVERSIDDVMRQHPEVFDFGVRAPGTDWPGVRNMDGYHQLVVQSLIAKGYCAIFDSEEIQIKKENRFTEHYDIHLGDGYVRRGEGAYRSTCWPAAF